MPETINEMFKTQAKSVRQIFGDADSYYQIPDYQRPYSWETKQIEELWDDVFSAMENKDSTYFLGATILTHTGDNYFEVVDGQQRLTTLTILLCVIRDIFLPKDKEITNSIQSLIDGKYRLRLITQSHNQTQFEKEVLAGLKFPGKHLSEEERERDPFLNAAIIFRDKLKSLKSAERVKEFVSYLMNKVVMITIISAKQSFAIRLFQVLNARGLPLSNADLIKSHLYAMCESDKSKMPQVKQDWIKVEAIGKDVKDDVKKDDAEDLLTYYGYYVLERNPRTNLYSELVGSKHFKGISDPTRITYELVKFATCYKEIYNSHTKLLYSFWYLPNAVYWRSILVTARFCAYKDFEQLAILLRKLYYGYWISGYTITKIKQTSFNIIGWVKGNKPISYIQKQVDGKFKEDEVHKWVKESLDADAYVERWLKPLLLLIEYNRTDDSKISFIELWDRNLQVEHILPEKWSTNPTWKKLWDEESATHWLNKLGNLTLLSGKKNVVASNDSFSKKKLVYKKAHGGLTAFEITKEIAEKDGWTDKDAKARHNELKQEILKILQL